MSRILLDHNPTTGVSTYYHSDPDKPGNAIIEKEWQEAGLHKLAHEQRVTTSGQKFGDMRHYARIPPAVLGQLMRDGRLNDPKEMQKWLRNEGKVFRTFEKTW